MQVKNLGLRDYQSVHREMLDFTLARGRDDEDQCWLVQHKPVYTQGTACQQLTLTPSAIPIVKTDRGGQLTYHGPGQIVMYPLLELKRHGLTIKSIVQLLEQAVIDCLATFAIEAERQDGAPGVYVNSEKIAALGLRIKKGCSYHGLSFNVDMDLSPFENIDPCGYQGLKVTSLAKLLDQKPDYAKTEEALFESFVRLLSEQVS